MALLNGSQAYIYTNKSRYILQLLFLYTYRNLYLVTSHSLPLYGIETILDKNIPPISQTSLLSTDDGENIILRIG